MNNGTTKTEISRVAALWEYLVWTSPKTPEKDRLQARWLASLTLAVILVALLSVFAEDLFFSESSFYQGSNRVVALANAVFSGLLYLINRFGFYNIAAKSFVLLTSISIFTFALPDQSLRDEQVLNYLLVAVVFSRLFLSTRFTLALILAHFAGMLAFSFLMLGGPIEESPLFPVATASLLILLAFHYRSMADARRHQAAQDELTTYANRLNTLRQIEQDILAAGSLETTAAAALEHLHTVLPYQRSSILFLDWENTEAQVLAIGSEKDSKLKAGMRIPLSAIPTVAALLNNERFYLIEDLSSHAEKSGIEINLMEAGMHSILCMPLKLEGELIGLLNLAEAEVSAYTHQHIDIAEEIANHLALALQQAQLTDEAETRADELETVRQTSISLISSTELETVLHEILKAALSLNPTAQHARIFLFEDHQLSKASSLEPNGEIPTQLPDPRPNGVTGTVARTGEAAIIPDVQNDPDYEPGHASWEGALVSLPLKIGARVVGVMNIQYIQPRRFEQAEVRLMKLFGDQAAIAIENARLYEAERLAHKRADSLLQIVRGAASQVSLKELLQNVLEQCGELVPFDSGSISTFEEEAPAVMAFTGQKSQQRLIADSLDLLKTSPILKRIRRTQKAELVGDTAEEPEWIKTPQGKHIRSWMGVPIVAREETIGLISLDSNEPYDFSIEDLSWVQALADEIAVVIQNARLYEQVQAYAAELESRVQQRTHELEKSYAEMEAFAYSMAHDLRAPLRATEGFSQALLEDFGEQLGEEGQAYTHRILNASRRLDDLIEDLLEYSRMSRADMHLQAVDLKKTIQEACSNLEKSIQESQAEIDIDIDNVKVMAHPLTMLQVVSNLMSNAIKFVAPETNPKVIVRTRSNGDAIRLEISDNGIGIKQEHHDRIFQIFERLHGIENYPGTGIGLAIVHRGVERMQGQVGFESQQEEGSTFWVELPKAEAA